MKHIPGVLVVALVFSVFAAAGYCREDSFDSEKMLEELEQRLELSKEKLQGLKPTIDAKSREMKKLIRESLDRGYLQMEEMARSLEEFSLESERKMRSVLDSEQARQLKDYLSRVDKDAIGDVRKKLVDEMTDVLELTEEQLAEIKPQLEDSLARLGEMIADFRSRGSGSWESFKNQYDELSRELMEELKEKLDRSQLEKLEKYQEDKKKKIHQALFV